MKNIKRGDIFYADLNTATCGSEQNGIRPVIIVQNNVGNYYSPTVIVAAITSKLKKNNMPTHIIIESGEGNLKRTSTVLLEQLMTIDKERLIRYVGSVNHETMCEINQAMLVSLGLSCA